MSTQKKWQTISSKVVYKSKWLTLIHDEVTTPDNKKAQYDIVERKNVAIIIPKIENSFYMVRQFRYPINSLSLEFPQGFCEEGESINQSVLREFTEETGLQAGKISLINTLWISSGFLRQKLVVYVAENFIEGNQKLDDTEVGLELVKINLEKIIKKLSQGEISNAPTVAALGLYLVSQKSS